MSGVLFVAMTVLLTAAAAWYFGAGPDRAKELSGSERHREH
jgi:hypothetical protein